MEGDSGAGLRGGFGAHGMTGDSTVIARLKVMLDDVEPPVLRHLEVPLDIRLDRLHLTLQAALGWTDSHLWEIRVGDGGWGIPDPDWPDGPLDARKATLWEIIEDSGAKTLHYLYDFGDGWEHSIKVLGIEGGKPGLVYPLLRDAAGRCPPEDVGGPWGYADFLDAIADPGHEQHEDMKEWYGQDFDPDDVALEDLKAAVAALAKRWNRKPRKKQPR